MIKDQQKRPEFVLRLEVHFGAGTQPWVIQNTVDADLGDNETVVGRLFASVLQCYAKFADQVGFDDHEAAATFVHELGLEAREVDETYGYRDEDTAINALVAAANAYDTAVHARKMRDLKMAEKKQA